VRTRGSAPRSMPRFGPPNAFVGSMFDLIGKYCFKPEIRAISLLSLAILQAASLSADPVAVRRVGGALHGFLDMRAVDGAIIASGDLTQVAHGSQLTSRLTFHFKDGSLQDETTVFSQRGHFRMVTDHLVQKGPSFKRPMDVSIDGARGLVTVRYADDKGDEKVETKNMTLPPDLANGMLPTLLSNIGPGTLSMTVSMLVATPKPMVVKLVISAEGEDSFSIGTAGHKATRYDVKVDIGGIKGALAPLVGKQPPDTLVWILDSSSPVFLKSEGPSFEDGPIWRIELASPVWPEVAQASAERRK
jgi:hypothetical protein